VVTFTPVASFTGEATPVTYTVEDELGQAASTTYTPTVLPPADPTADPEETQGPKGAPQGIDLLDGDVTAHSEIVLVPESVVLSCTDGVENCTVDENGVVTIDGVGTYAIDADNPGVMVFTPDEDFVGVGPSVTYTVEDSVGGSVSSTYTPTVVAPPVVVPDVTTGEWNTPQSINVVTNTEGTSDSVDALTDWEPSSITISCGVVASPECVVETDGAGVVTKVTMAGEGSYTVDAATNVVTFTPVASFTGEATPVTYTVEDELGQAASTTYTPTVLSPGGLTADPETSLGGKGEQQWVDLIDGDTASNSSITLDRASVILSCTEATSCTVSDGGKKVTIAGVGTYEVDSQNPGFAIFTPTATFVGDAPSVTYTVEDSIGRTVSSTYTPTVLDAPVVEPDYSRGPANEPQSRNVLDNDNVEGANLLPETLQLRDPITQELLDEPTVEVPGEGVFVFEGSTITFTPNLDELVAALVADPTRLIKVLDDNGNVIGLEVEVTPITYQLLDAEGRTVTATYYPVVFFPNPVAAPDVSYGPADEPQSQPVLSNDSATGAQLVLSTFMMVDPVTGEPTDNTSIVMPGEGTFVFTGDAIQFTPNLEQLIATLVANPTRLITVYQLDENGDQVLDQNGQPIAIGLEAEITPITYQIKDEFGRLVTTTYTPKLYFPNPVAAPDYSRGPADQPQSQQILSNDASTGTKLLPETLQLLHPVTGVALNVGDYRIELPDEGTFTFDGSAIIFTPNMDALIEMLRQDLLAHQGDYDRAKLREVYVNGVYMGLEADITPITYTVLDEFGRLVTTTYYPKVFFPKPAASPDFSQGAINEPQRKEIISNDDPSKGIAFEQDYLMIWNPSNGGSWGLDPVETAEGVYTVEAGEGITLQTAGFGGAQKVVLATNVTASGEFNQLVFTPRFNWTGTATPVRYQVKDVFGQKVESTYTPTIETETIASAIGKLVRTGGNQLQFALQMLAVVFTVGVGLKMSSRRRRLTGKL
jgi:CshA-type fibril repeat protein